MIKARVANTVLGGGSQGRLFLDLREKHAWTYGCYSTIKEDELASSGSFTAYAKCRNAVSDSSVGAIIDEMHRMQTEKVNDQDLQNTVNYMSGNFAIALEDPARVAQFAINIERYHMPKDYYENYLTNLKAVTADDIMEVSKKYIRPENANIIVVGSKSEVADKLVKYASDGKITYYDNFGRVAKAEPKAAAAPADMTADAIIKKYISAIGGENAINGIKDIKTISASEMQGMPLTITEMKKAPGKLKIVIEASMNGQKLPIQKMAYNGAQGYQEQQGKKADLQGDDLNEIKAQADMCEEAHGKKYGVTRTLKGTEKANGKDAYVIEATDAKGKKATEYYDMASGLLVMKAQTQDGPQGPVTETSEYNDYKEVPGTNGYKLPYTVKVSTGADQGYTATVQNVEVNKSIADSEFN
jgi:zinc protease